MDLTGCYFVYNGEPSDIYDLIFSHVDTDENTLLHGEFDHVNLYTKANKRHFFIGYDYSESNAIFDVEITTSDGSDIPEYNLKEIKRWLFDNIGYKRLYAYEGSTVSESYLNCILINPEKIESGSGIVGFKCQLICDSSMAWKELKDITVDVNNSSDDEFKVITVNVDTDFKDYIYPRVDIAMGSDGGDLIIVNNTDDSSRTTEFSDLTGGITLSMNGNVNSVSGGNFSKFSVRNFIRLLNGKNRLTVIGNVDTIRFRFNEQEYI